MSTIRSDYAHCMRQDVSIHIQFLEFIIHIGTKLEASMKTVSNRGCRENELMYILTQCRIRYAFMHTCIICTHKHIYRENEVLNYCTYSHSVSRMCIQAHIQIYVYTLTNTSTE